MRDVGCGGGARALLGECRVELGVGGAAGGGRTVEGGAVWGGGGGGEGRGLAAAGGQQQGSGELAQRSKAAQGQQREDALGAEQGGKGRVRAGRLPKNGKAGAGPSPTHGGGAMHVVAPAPAGSCIATGYPQAQHYPRPRSALGCRRHGGCGAQACVGRHVAGVSRTRNESMVGCPRARARVTQRASDTTRITRHVSGV